MSQALEQLVTEAKQTIESAADLKQLDEERVRLLGKKGVITEQMKSLGQLEPEQRKEAGGI